jgi:hypothetical protein
MAAYTIPSAAAVLVTFIGEVQAELETSVQSEVAAASPSVLDVVKISSSSLFCNSRGDIYLINPALLLPTSFFFVVAQMRTASRKPLLSAMIPLFP